MKKNILTGSMVAFGNALMAKSAYAVNYVLSNETGTGNTDLLVWVDKLLGYAVGLTAIVAVAILIFAGYSYITANGDEGKVKKATQAMVYAIVGMVIAFAANMIIRFVINNVLNAK
ncbi:hypothetical protein J6Z48_00355 [bacterium]|nr:hypothetical protein [bacterium]